MEKITNEALVEQYRAGDQQALVELWLKNERFVRSIANKLCAYAELEDLLQEGFIGLRTAADLYDPEQGALFITYSGYWIRQAMSRFIENCGGTVRLPAHAHDKIRRMKKAQEHFLGITGRQPTRNELARILEITLEQLQDLEQASRMEKGRSLAEPIPGEDELQLQDMIPGESSPEDEIIEALDQQRLAAIIQEEIEKLPQEEQEALHARFWDEAEELTAEQKNALKRAKRALKTPYVRRRLEPFFPAAAFIGGHVGVRQFQSTGISEPLQAVLRAERAEELYFRQIENKPWKV